ncbi:MAG: hypothetical protein J5I65_00930 [Aridibacter famidurans]|nr:hypothetical protein [Aridibacter famidurans]
MRSPRDFSFQEIEEGSEYSETYRIGDEAIAALTGVFEDRSPVHVDEDYAREAGFEGRVSHGAILNCFLSHFIGMRFPGRRSMLLSANLNYRLPCYAGDELTLKAMVKQTVESAGVIVLDVRFLRGDEEELVASGRVQVKVRDA